MKVFTLLVLVFSCAAALSPRLNLRGLRAPPLPEGAKLPEAKWLDSQKLDHFNMSDDRTWRQRYFVNDTFWEKETGPVFLMLGGEGPANSTWLAADTEIMINAKTFKALVFMIEHRYYGESHPTVDLSLESLKYLSSRQALRDIFYFTTVMGKQYKLTSKNRWISFGGSYSGALSGWLKTLYPDTITGAIATSAPVLAKTDFFEYLEVVTQSLETASKGKDCVTAVKAATSQVDSWLLERQSWAVVENTFNIAPPISSVDDAAQVATSLAGNFMGVVQYNRDNTAFEGRPNNITIETLCDIMADESLGAPVLRYAAVNKLMTKNRSLDCNYLALLKEMGNSSWSGPAAGGGRQWYYQTCTEFGYYQTTDSPNQIFGKLISLKSQLDICSKVYNIPFERVAVSVGLTNIYYGGLGINGTNIVFPNGSIDPWHKLGVQVVPFPDSQTPLFITGTAHCANMYPPSPEDPPALTDARNSITEAIGKWLK